jgi:hypothetical protein
MTMLLSKPQWWFDEIVTPNYMDCLSNALSQRHAFNAFVTTFHMWERLYWYYRETGSPHLGGRSETEFFDHLRSQSQCPDLEELRTAANPAKHSYIRAEAKASPSFKIEFTSTGQAQIPIGGGVGGLILPSGREVRHLLTAVMRFWAKWLRGHPDP